MSGIKNLGRRSINWLLLRSEREMLEAVWAEFPEASTQYKLYAQRAESADVLWSQGLTADGLYLARLALESLDEVLRSYDASDLQPAIPPTTRADFEATRKELDAESPRLDSEVVAKHEQLIDSSRANAARLAKQLRRFAQDQREIKSRTRWRAGSAIFCLLVMGSAAVYFLRPPPDITISASSALTDPTTTYTGDRAHDGQTTTEWLPEPGPGFWEVRFGSSRRVQELRILNGVNAALYDRGAQDYEVEFYSGSSKVQSTRGHFDQVQQPVPVPVRGPATSIDRIRIVIRSHYGLGPALAEVTWR